MGAEKESELTAESQNVTEEGSIVQVEDQTPTNAALGEAAEVYGTFAVAEELGYVQRGYVYLW